MFVIRSQSVADFVGDNIGIGPIIDVHRLRTADHSNVGIIAVAVLHVDIVSLPGTLYEGQWRYRSPGSSRIPPVLPVRGGNSGIEDVVNNSIRPTISRERAFDA